MIIDCQTCPVRGTHCAECMVPVVARQWLGDPGRAPHHDHGSLADEGELDDAEWEAVDVFVRAGMINTLVAAGTTATVAARGAWSRVG